MDDEPLEAGSRILVTGAGGRIGTAAVDHLIDRGYAVTALSKAFGRRSSADRVLEGDSSDAQLVDDGLRDASAVVHLAAIPSPTLGTPEEVYRTNVLSTFTVLARAAERGIRRAVIASSINASGIPNNPHRVLPAYFPIDEELPADLGDAYSLSKASDELTAGMAARAWGMDVVALRFPFTAPLATLIETAAEIEQDPARNVREGWSYLDVRDAARAIECALVARVDGAQVVGLAADDILLREPTAALLERYAPAVPRRAVFAGREALVDTARARALLGFVPTYSVHDPA